MISSFSGCGIERNFTRVYDQSGKWLKIDKTKSESSFLHYQPTGSSMLDYLTKRNINKVNEIVGRDGIPDYIWYYDSWDPDLRLIYLDKLKFVAARRSAYKTCEPSDSDLKGLPSTVIAQFRKRKDDLRKEKEDIKAEKRRAEKIAREEEKARKEIWQKRPANETKNAAGKVSGIEGFQDAKFGMNEMEYGKTNLANNGIILFNKVRYPEVTYRKLTYTAGRYGTYHADLQSFAIDLSDVSDYGKIVQLLKRKYEVSCEPSKQLKEIWEEKEKNMDDDLLFPQISYSFCNSQVILAVLFIKRLVGYKKQVTLFYMDESSANMYKVLEQKANRAASDQEWLNVNMKSRALKRAKNKDNL